MPRKGKRYRKRVGLQAAASLIYNHTDIDRRSTIVEQNSEFWHWAGDIVHDQDGYFVTLVERVLKVFLSARVPNKTQKTVGRGIRTLLKLTDQCARRLPLITAVSLLTVLQWHVH